MRGGRAPTHQVKLTQTTALGAEEMRAMERQMQRLQKIAMLLLLAGGQVWIQAPGASLPLLG